MRGLLVEKVSLGKQEHLSGSFWQVLKPRIVYNARIHILFPSGLYANSVPTAKTSAFAAKNAFFPRSPGIWRAIIALPRANAALLLFRVGFDGEARYP
jgi:hypothetical protein